MSEHDEPARKTEAPCISTLSAAILRINASHDVSVALREVVESARALTAARYGVIIAVDADGEIEDYITSGFTPEESRQLLSRPDGPGLAALRDLDRPIRMSNLLSYARALGLSTEPMLSNPVQGVPMRHCGTYVGYFILGEKKGGEEFTEEDEEVLALFASQAATVIANARTHRDEKRVRADLEALIATSPVGVVVFDARTGHALSFNREASRIVERLRMPGHPTEHLLDVLTCRRADGSEVAFGEFARVQVLGAAETVRAEEIVLSVPDGRSLRTLINATPNRSSEGAVASADRIRIVCDVCPESYNRASMPGYGKARRDTVGSGGSGQV